MKRRSFIKKLGMASVAPVLLNNIPVRLLAGSPLLSQFDKNFSTDNVLIFIQMHGGNDGLNMIVPVSQYATYYNLRPNIALPDEGTRRFINVDTSVASADQVGLHPDMQFTKQMYDEGKVAVVQNVGYENMNLSHFRGRDIVFMGGGSDDHFSSGWMGRFLDNVYPGYPESYPNSDMPDPLALEIGNLPSLAFHREAGIPVGIHVDSPLGFYNLINSVGTEPPIEFPDSYAGDELRYLMQFEDKTNAYATRLRDVYNAGSNSSVDYPEVYPQNAPSRFLYNPLAGQLKLIARLLKGGSKTRIFMVRIGGFDTHAGQVEEYDTTMGGHAALMYHISSAVKSFFDDLKILGLDEKVMAMTFTEFGRRVHSNLSYGTDHGTATPVLLFGPRVKEGVYGTNPDLTKLRNGNLIYQIDYRQIYTSVVKDWLGASDATLQATGFSDWLGQRIDLIEGVVGAPFEQAKLSDSALESCSPNPASGLVSFSYFLQQSGQTSLILFDTMGRQVARVVDQEQFYGSHQVTFDVSQLPRGTYIYQLQTGGRKFAKKLLVQ